MFFDKIFNSLFKWVLVNVWVLMIYLGKVIDFYWFRIIEIKRMSFNFMRLMICI